MEGLEDCSSAFLGVEDEDRAAGERAFEEVFGAGVSDGGGAEDPFSGWNVVGRRHCW